MQAFPPTRNKQQPDWEGGEFPPLRMRGEKRSILEPDPLPAPEPAAKSTVVKLVGENQPRRSWLWRQVLTLLFVALFSIPAYYIASEYIVTAVVIKGRSMMPTLKDGERYFLNRWRYLILAPQRGDVVVIKDPGHQDYAVKRIVGRPYDWLNFKDGVLYINGKRLEEPYLSTNTRTDTSDMSEKWIQLGRNQYFLLGDNRANSEDSRFYGVVHRKNIIGMVIK
jgi:signal peptidase I